MVHYGCHWLVKDWFKPSCFQPSLAGNQVLLMSNIVIEQAVSFLIFIFASLL